MQPKPFVPPLATGPHPAAKSAWHADPWVRFAVRVWALIGILVIAWALGRLLSPLRPLLLPVILATMFVVLLAPAVDRLQRNGVPRFVGTAASMLGLLGVVALTFVLLVPPLVTQFTEVFEDLPGSLAEAETELQALVDRVGLDYAVVLNSDQVTQWLESENTRRMLAGWAAGLGAVTAAALVSAFLLLFAPVLAFYMLCSPRRQRGAWVNLFPAGEPRRHAAELGRRCGHVVAAYVRGQLLVALFVGVSSACALWAIGLEYWLLVGFVAGVTNLVPFVGPFVGGALAVIIALLTADPMQALWAAGVILIVQQVESYLVAPLVLGRVVRLPALAIMIAVMIGAMVGGLVGMLVAVPVAACGRVALEYYREMRDLPPEEPDPPDPPMPAARLPEPPADRPVQASRAD